MIDSSPHENPARDGEGEMGDDGKRRKMATETKWVMIDKNYNDRLWHKGDTILPGAGASWKHFPSSAKGSRERKAAQRAGRKKDLIRKKTRRMERLGVKIGGWG